MELILKAITLGRVQDAPKPESTSQNTQRFYLAGEADTRQKMNLDRRAAASENRDSEQLAEAHRDSMRKSLARMATRATEQAAKQDPAIRFPSRYTEVPGKAEGETKIVPTGRAKQQAKKHTAAVKTRLRKLGFLPKAEKKKEAPYISLRSIMTAAAGKKAPVNKSHGKKKQTDPLRRTELYPAAYTAITKACETHKASPCPPDCPHTLNKDYAKSVEAYMDFGKPVPPRRAGESDFQRQIRHHMGHKDKHPGGRDQAIAIAASEAGVSKAMSWADLMNGDIRKGLEGYHEDEGVKAEREKKRKAQSEADYKRQKKKRAEYVAGIEQRKKEKEEARKKAAISPEERKRRWAKIEAREAAEAKQEAAVPQDVKDMRARKQAKEDAAERKARKERTGGTYKLSKEWHKKKKKADRASAKRSLKGKLGAGATWRKLPPFHIGRAVGLVPPKQEHIRRKGPHGLDKWRDEAGREKKVRYKAPETPHRDPPTAPAKAPAKAPRKKAKAPRKKAKVSAKAPTKAPTAPSTEAPPAKAPPKKESGIQPVAPKKTGIADPWASMKSLEATSKSYYGDDWLSKYKGTPLIDDAIKLAEQCIDIEEERLKNRRNLMSQHDEKLWRKEDKIRLAKQRLDLRLAKVQAKDVKKSTTAQAIDLLKSAAAMPVPQGLLQKALTTRNFAMPRIGAIQARYNANQILRSAMTQTSRNHSALAPPVAETLEQVAQTEPQRTQRIQPLARSVCAAHGMAFKSDNGCPACGMAKSLETERPDVRYHLR